MPVNWMASATYQKRIEKSVRNADMRLVWQLAWIQVVKGPFLGILPSVKTSSFCLGLVLNEDQKKARFRKSLEKKSEPLPGNDPESDGFEGFQMDNDQQVEFEAKMLDRIDKVYKIFTFKGFIIVLLISD
jgi:hypothetical protein